jgi:2-polyprenyl-3-methyl-5-hydroxy-6-metoxy-1,4-benzoquinol methylase
MPSTREWNQHYETGQNSWSWNFNALCYWAYRLGFTNGTALDLGCGIGEKTWLLQRLGLDATGIDGSEIAIAKARELFPGIRYEAFDLERLEEFDPGPFDVILDMKVLPFIKDRERYLAAVRGRLRGHYLLEVPVKHWKDIAIPREELDPLLRPFKIVDKQEVEGNEVIVVRYALR